MAQSDTVARTTWTESVSGRVVDAVAETTGADPLSIDPLSDVVDSEALDALFEAGEGRTPDGVEFTYEGCDVTVRADGSVSVTESS